MKNNQCHECGLYYFQCKCHGRKGASYGKKKKKATDEPYKSHRHVHSVPEVVNELTILQDINDTDNAIRRINEAEAEFFGDDPPYGS